MIRVPSVARALACVLPMLLGACASGARAHRSSSVVKYLYPEKQARAEASKPHLRVPLAVGIAFVPEEAGAPTDGGALPEAARFDAMRRVASRFRDRPFVRRIEIIPSAYLTPRGSFTNLDELRAMFDVDVIALLSYDQIQFSHESKLSLTYLTIAGAYLVEGERNETRTMVDAAVIDVASRRLLFRAPGVSRVRTSATPVEVERELRKDAERGLQLATDDMVKQLDAALELFTQHVKERPTEFRVEQRQAP